MSYCRYRNTLLALQDCYNNLPQQDLSKDEARAFAELVELSKSIAERYEDTEDYFELVKIAEEDLECEEYYSQND